MGTRVQAGDSRIEFHDGRAAISGPLSFESVPGLFRSLEQRAAGETPVRTIDLDGVTAADSAGLALLLEWQARARSDGRELAVCNAPDSLLSLARLCEAVDLLDLSGRDGDGAEES